MIIVCMPLSQTLSPDLRLKGAIGALMRPEGADELGAWRASVSPMGMAAVVPPSAWAPARSIGSSRVLAPLWPQWPALFCFCGLLVKTGGWIRPAFESKGAI